MGHFLIARFSATDFQKSSLCLLVLTRLWFGKPLAYPKLEVISLGKECESKCVVEISVRLIPNLVFKQVCTMTSQTCSLKLGAELARGRSTGGLGQEVAILYTCLVVSHRHIANWMPCVVQHFLDKCIKAI